MTVEVDVASAAVWAGVLAASAAAVGAYLAAAAGRASAGVIRGGVASVCWALGLLVVGFLVIATVEPDVTRRYVDGLGVFGPVGPALFGVHLLALPAQSALLLIPASGSCVDLLASGATALRICPWSLDPAGPLAGAFFSRDAVSLSPWFWALIAIPSLAAFLGGRIAGAGVPAVRGAVRGAARRDRLRGPGDAGGGVRRSSGGGSVLHGLAPVWRSSRGRSGAPGSCASGASSAARSAVASRAVSTRSRGSRDPPPRSSTRSS